MSSEREGKKRGELNNNLLQRLEDVNVLKKYVPDLVTLDLSNNPISTVTQSRTTVPKAESPASRVRWSPARSWRAMTSPR